ncbi:uncharacterized protein LOC141702260 [Apium graveolens]|uniref:uncharacterized protein LOC141702260 n=1 Tax=Apium graveolens TaxID=4045 RepID=UPI003D796351
MRGQGYDGASNMCGAFNGLQALFLKDCPYVYYNIFTGFLKGLHELQAAHDLLCRALQSKSIDILNAMDSLATRIELLQFFRVKGFDIILDYVMSLKELHYRFNNNYVQILRLSSSLEPKNNFRLFDIEHICTLATSFYSADCRQQMMLHLKLQLDHYKIDVVKHAKFQDLSIISELCLQLVDTGKAEQYNLIYMLIYLVLEEYLRDSMLINIKREYAEDIDLVEVMDEFIAQKNRRLDSSKRIYVVLGKSGFLASKLRSQELTFHYSEFGDIPILVDITKKFKY